MAFTSNNINDESNSYKVNTTNGHFSESCSNKVKDALTIMTSDESTKNLNSTIYTIPLSICIDFSSLYDNPVPLAIENSDRAETGKTNLILESTGNFSIVPNSYDKNTSSIFEAFLGCPVPTPPNYQDQWILLEFNRENYGPLEFGIPIIIEEFKILIEKYEFGCTLIIREFTNNNTLSEYRIANTKII
jgi:hypothetical protein